MSTLAQFENDFFSTALNKYGRTNDLKRELFSQEVSSDVSLNPNGLGESVFLQNFISDYGGTVFSQRKADLYAQALGLLGLTTPNSYNEKKKLFYTSFISQLYYSIKSLPNLNVYYPMNELSGTVCTNRAPATKGTKNGTNANATVNQSGTVGKAYGFNGTSSVVSCSLWSNATTNITMGAIYKSTDYTVNGQTIISNGAGTQPSGRGYSLVLSGNATTDGSLMILDHNVKWLDTTYNVQDNNAHLYNLVLNASGFPIVYVDGAVVYNPGSNTFAVPNTSSLIGEGGAAIDGFARYAKGQISHAYFATSIHTTAQILRLARLAKLAA